MTAHDAYRKVLYMLYGLADDWRSEGGEVAPIMVDAYLSAAHNVADFVEELVEEELNGTD